MSVYKGTTLIAGSLPNAANQDLSNLSQTGQAVIDGKADINLNNVPASKGILTESYVNGTSWYRVYSDGWIEQGGAISSIPNNSTSTISLLKSFSNTNYSVMATVNWSGAYGNHIAVTNKRTSTFQLYNYRSSGNNSYSLNATWYACGY